MTMLSKSYTEQQCMTFYYHMYGSGMGTLEVKIDGNTLFSKSGNQGNQWLEGKVNVGHSGSPYQVREF